MSCEAAIRVRDLSKHFAMFERPQDRLKQMLVPRLQRAAGLAPKRYFQEFTALSGVSFEVARGETVGIVGRNGCGKSTLLQIVCGTLQPSSGTVEVNGRIAALLELGAGFNPEFTGRENVYMNAAILGLTRAQTDERFDEIARFADIGIFIDQPVKTYSSGMYVRLAFAVAISVDPDILVVDEALAVGDEAFQRKCFARIEQIRERGGTILFVSHAAQTVVQLCDRAILLDRGEVLLDGKPKIVVNQYQRFLNLSGASAETAREQIRAMDGWTAPAGKEREEGGGDEAAAGDGGDTAAAAESAPQASDESWFDPNLKSDSRVEYESRGARIRDIRITTLDGRAVNVLTLGHSYIYEYLVDIERDAEDFVCGMAIRTVQGVDLGGTATHLTGDRIAHVSAGQTLRVRFRFDCIARPGVYFLNCGVGSLKDGEAALHRILDAICFRVAESDTLNFTNLVDFSISPTIDIAD